MSNDPLRRGRAVHSRSRELRSAAGFRQGAAEVARKRRLFLRSKEGRYLDAAAARHERQLLQAKFLVLAPLELVLAKVSPRGARQEWRFNPSWTRLERREHEEFGLQQLSLVSRGRSVEVAAFLGPEEKAAFARDLGRALSEARRGPQFS